MRPAQEVISFLEEFAPLQLAEKWDNVGLLLGDRSQLIERVMTCLTLTPDVAEEAVREKVGMIVCHHPVLFKAIQRLTADTHEGQMLLQLARTECLVYSPHTAFDSARDGINAGIAEALGLQEIRPLRPCALEPDGSLGSGRCGLLPEPVSLQSLIETVSSLLSATSVQLTGDPDRLVTSIAIACGSAAEFLPDAVRAGCDVLLTGEARFHAFLEARTGPTALVTLGHFATERPAVERLATILSDRFPGLNCFASRVERDPVLAFPLASK
jgi:dinuclear metal center YbgI/SA1388 family protein